MSDDNIITPWRPEQDLLRLAVLGKLIEECNELSARAARCIIHGLDERDPATGLTNTEELQKEISDVYACLEIVSLTTTSPIYERIASKKRGFLKWHEMIKEMK